MRSQEFGQRLPPLYVAIQKILDKYPDGQIFKVQLYYNNNNNNIIFFSSLHNTMYI